MLNVSDIFRPTVLEMEGEPGSSLVTNQNKACSYQQQYHNNKTMPQINKQVSRKQKVARDTVPICV